MKNVLLSLLLVFGLCSVAHADILTGPVHRSQSQVAFQQNATASGVGTIDTNTILADAAQIINYLGVREGSAYIFTKRDRGFVNYVGATLITKWNTAADVGLLGVNGLGGSIDYNFGAFLAPLVPSILQYTQYLYAGVGGGVVWDNGTGYACGFADIQFKTTF